MNPSPASSPSPDPAVLRPGRLAALVQPVLVAGAGGTLAAGASLRVLPATVAAATAVICGSASYGATLIRLAWAMHRRTRQFGPCRGIGFLGLGIALLGVTAVGTTLGGYGTTGATIGVTGTVVAAVVNTFGLLLLPGAAPTARARLRRALDGAGIGACLFFAAWLLVIAPHGGLTAAPFLVALTTCMAFTVAVVTGVRAVRYRRAALTCAAGASLAILGAGAGALALLRDRPAGWWLATAAAAQLAGPALVVTGARWADLIPRRPDPPDVDGTFASYPMLAAPLVIALGTAVYHLLRGGAFDVAATSLAIGAVCVLTAREALAAADVRRYAGRLAAREAHFRSLVAGSTDVTVVLDGDLVVRWQSPAAARQFGLAEQDVLGRPFTALIHPEDVARVADRLAALRDRRHPPEPATDGTGALLEARLRDGFGRWRDTESTISDQRAVPEVAALVLHVRDVGDRKALERSLHHMSWTDQVTGLANRRKLLHAAAELRAAGGRGGAILLVQLDGLAGIAGIRGQDTADAVLVEAALRLRTGVDERDVAARIGTDEFAVLADTAPVSAYALATRLVTLLGEPYDLPGTTARLQARVGVADLHGGSEIADVMRHADLARRRAAQLGPGRVECFDESIEAALVRSMTIEQDLPGAVDRDELDLLYQPVLELDGRVPVGVEALLRWRHPALGAVGPAEMVPVAERLGLIARVGEWVLHRACRQLALWRRDGRELWMSVNVSARQLHDDAFLVAVASALDAHGVPPEGLLVELAEHGLDDDVPAVARRIAALRDLGVRTSIDGFGTGRAALANLRRLPVDLLKTDRVFVAEPGGAQGRTAPILEAVVEMGRRLGVEVVACGLEDAAQVAAVRAAGCRLGQGYVLAAPGHAEHVEAFLDSRRTRLF